MEFVDMVYCEDKNLHNSVIFSLKTDYFGYKSLDH